MNIRAESAESDGIHDTASARTGREPWRMPPFFATVRTVIMIGSMAFSVGCASTAKPAAPSGADQSQFANCQGACSHHGGIDCDAGPGPGDHVKCEDGFVSSVPYDDCCPR